MTRAIISTLMLLILSSCASKYGDFFPCHDDGCVKPHVVLLPVSDTTCHPELAECLQNEIRGKLMCNGDLYLYSEESVNSQLNSAGLCNTSFFNPEINFASKFGGADFVVATEIVECRSDLYGNIEDKCMPRHLRCKDLFMLKIRMRVIDLRCGTPTVVLQEVFGRSMLIPNRRCGPDDIDMSCFNRVCKSVVEDFVSRLECIAWRNVR